MSAIGTTIDRLKGPEIPSRVPGGRAGIVLLLSFLFVDVSGMKRREWNLLLSGAAIGVSLILCIERWPSL